MRYRPVAKKSNQETTQTDKQTNKEKCKEKRTNPITRRRKRPVAAKLKTKPKSIKTEFDGATILNYLLASGFTFNGEKILIGWLLDYWLESLCGSMFDGVNILDS